MGIAETGFSIQMGERAGQPNSSACLGADRLPTVVRTKGMKMTTLPKMATDETCTAEWPCYTSPICLCAQDLLYPWQKSCYWHIVSPLYLGMCCYSFHFELDFQRVGASINWIAHLMFLTCCYLLRKMCNEDINLASCLSAVSQRQNLVKSLQRLLSLQLRRKAKH